MVSTRRNVIVLSKASLKIKEVTYVRFMVLVGIVKYSGDQVKHSILNCLFRSNGSRPQNVSVQIVTEEEDFHVTSRCKTRTFVQRQCFPKKYFMSDNNDSSLQKFICAETLGSDLDHSHLYTIDHSIHL